MVPFLSYVSSCDGGIRAGLYKFLSVLLSRGAPDSHPLVTYLKDFLMVINGNTEATVSEWMRSNGMTAEEVYACVGGESIPQVESFVSALAGEEIRRPPRTHYYTTLITLSPH